jgi:hypothetical protein
MVKKWVVAYLIVMIVAGFVHRWYTIWRFRK